MKKIILGFAAIMILISCDDGIQDGIVDPGLGDIQVEEITAPETLVYTDESTAVVSTLSVDSKDIVSSIWFDILAVDGSVTLIRGLEMKDDGNLDGSGDESADDNIFTGTFLMSEQYPNGGYAIDYYMSSNSGITKKIGAAKFDYDNAQENKAPLLSDLSMPDQIERSVQFVFSVQASDENGLSDIRYVYFNLYRPDGSQVIDERINSPNFFMADNGDSDVYGDEIEGDGIYSFKNLFGPEAALGTWVFTFRAEDRGGKLSNEIVHNIEVQ